MRDDRANEGASKVPAITLGFWLIKIFATTFGETAGDTVTMSWLGETTSNPVPNGYLIGSLIFSLVLIALVWAQIRAHRFNRWLYWTTIVASTTAGTAMADFADRSLGVGYVGGSLILLACVGASLLAWKRTLGNVDVNRIVSARAEAFYWITITFSQTLGTALGDWAADSGLGYGGGALLFGGLLALLGVAFLLSNASRVALFWAAFILTRPLGATVGDFLDKPLGGGGLGLDRPLASAVLIVAIAAMIAILPQDPGKHPAAGRSQP
jgi:uncharacterized membrane-anchored protein